MIKFYDYYTQGEKEFQKYIVECKKRYEQQTEEERAKEKFEWKISKRLNQWSEELLIEKCEYSEQRYLTFQKMSETARSVGEREQFDVTISYLEENRFGGTITMSGDGLCLSAGNEVARNDVMWLVSTAKECYLGDVDGLFTIYMVYDVYKLPNKTPEA